MNHDLKSSVVILARGVSDAFIDQYVDKHYKSYRFYKRIDIRKALNNKLLSKAKKYRGENGKLIVSFDSIDLNLFEALEGSKMFGKVEMKIVFLPDVYRYCLARSKTGCMVNQSKKQWVTLIKNLSKTIDVKIIKYHEPDSTISYTYPFLRRNIEDKIDALNKKHFGFSVEPRLKKDYTLSIYDTTESLDLLESKMLAQKKVFYVRFGDNDLMGMMMMDRMGNSLQSAIGHNKTMWNPGLSEQVKNSFQIEHPNYLRGVVGWHKSEKGMSKNIFHPQEDILFEACIHQLTDTRRFYHATFLHYVMSYKPERFNKFLDDCIRPNRVLFIGSAQQTQHLLGEVKYTIETPKKQSYKEYGKVLSEILRIIHDIDVIVASCGQLARVLPAMLWDLPYDFHYLDMGSIFSIFDGEEERTWHKKLDTEQIIKNYE